MITLRVSMPLAVILDEERTVSSNLGVHGRDESDRTQASDTHSPQEIHWHDLESGQVYFLDMWRACAHSNSHQSPQVKESPRKCVCNSRLIILIYSSDATLFHFSLAVRLTVADSFFLSLPLSTATREENISVTCTDEKCQLLSPLKQPHHIEIIRRKERKKERTKQLMNERRNLILIWRRN